MVHCQDHHRAKQVGLWYLRQYLKREMSAKPNIAWKKWHHLYQLFCQKSNVWHSFTREGDNILSNLLQFTDIFWVRLPHPGLKLLESQCASPQPDGLSVMLRLDQVQEGASLWCNLLCLPMKLSPWFSPMAFALFLIPLASERTKLKLTGLLTLPPHIDYANAI